MNSSNPAEKLVKQIQKQVKQQQYLKALASLDTLEVINGSNQQIVWYKALLECKVGRLHIARHYLTEIQGDLRLQAELIEEEIQKNWPVYTFLVEEYNAAVAEIRAGDSENALYILSDALHRVGTLTVPLEVYRMNTLLLARYRPDLLSRFILDLPTYAMDDRVIKRVLAERTAPSLSEEPEVQLPVNPPPSNKRAMVLSVVMLGVLGLSGYAWLSERGKEVTEPDPPVEVPVEVVEEPVDPNSTLSEVDVPSVLADDEKILFVSAEVAEEYYIDGMKDYQNGNFSRASKSFEQAIRSFSSEYFSDDAAYYLTASYMREQAYEQAVQTAQQFQQEESTHYVESPYRDAIRLLESGALLELDQQEEAKSILEELSNKDEVDWVNYEAAKLLATLAPDR